MNEAKVEWVVVLLFVLRVKHGTAGSLLCSLLLTEDKEDKEAKQQLAGGFHMGEIVRPTIS